MSDDPTAFVPLMWHMFDPELTDEQVTAALASISVGVLSIEREKRIVWVDKGNEMSPEIQQVLKRWSFWKGEPQT